MGKFSDALLRWRAPFEEHDAAQRAHIKAHEEDDRPRCVTSGTPAAAHLDELTRIAANMLAGTCWAVGLAPARARPAPSAKAGARTFSPSTPVSSPPLDRGGIVEAVREVLF